MATYTKSFAAENPTELLRRLIGVRGATVRRVTKGTPRGTKVTFAETATGVLATINAPSIEVARTIVEKLKEIACAKPVVDVYQPRSTQRELIGMLIGKRGAVLTSIGRKHNVKIFYHGDEGRFSIEGVSAADVAGAIEELRSREMRAMSKLAERAFPAVISLDGDVPPPPPTLPLTRQNAVIDLDASVSLMSPRILVANALGVPVESVTAESVAGFANKDAAMGSPAWIAYHHIVSPVLDVPPPPPVVREVAGVTTQFMFVTDEEKASRNRSAFVHTVCEMFQARGMFTDLTPETSAELMAAANTIADEQLARDVAWDEMVAGAEERMPPHV